MDDFSGVKIALLLGNKLILIQRDDKPGLRWAGLWDLPGGARDGLESPIACATREVEEELGITLKPEAIIWQKEYPAMHDSGQLAYFMAANVSQEQIENITFGNEGQGWKLATIEAFMKEPNAVGPLKDRLRDYLNSRL